MFDLKSEIDSLLIRMLVKFYSKMYFSYSRMCEIASSVIVIGRRQASRSMQTP